MVRLHENTGTSTAFQLFADFDVQRGKYLTRLWLNSIGGLFAASSLTMIVTPWHCPSWSPSQRTRAVVELGISSEPDARILPTTDTLVHAFSNDAILDCVDACLLGS